MSSKVQTIASHVRTTPGLLQAFLVAIWLASIAVFAATISGTDSHRSALVTVGREAAPSIVNAQRIRAGLADMDALVANELVGKPGENMKAVKGYEEKRKEVLLTLSVASENLSFGDTERKEIRTLVEGLGTYQSIIAQARSFHEHGDAAALASYRRATTLMHKDLLPAADRLDRINSEMIEKTYAAQSRTSTIGVTLIWVSGAFLVGVLVTVQLFLKRRMRRIINPALLGATALSVVFLGYASISLLHSSAKLKEAKSDIFPHVSEVWQTLATVSDAKGRQSSWLFDRAQSEGYAQAFAENAAKLKKSSRASGELAAYLEVDGKIREMENSGKHSAAVRLSIGNDPGEANFAFNKYSQALRTELDAKQAEFDKAVSSGLAELNMLGYLAPVLALLVAALAVLGLMPRINEYKI